MMVMTKMKMAKMMSSTKAIEIRCSSLQLGTPSVLGLKKKKKKRWMSNCAKFLDEQEFEDEDQCNGTHVCLISYPRSGNTMVRSLLESTTGIYTGSDTRPGRGLADQLANWGLRGEGEMGNRVWIVKTHYPERSGWKPLRIRRGILLTRCVLNVLVSYFNMLLSASHEKSVADSAFRRFAKLWQEFVADEVALWRRFHEHWLAQPVDLIVTRYEDFFGERKLCTMRTLVDFLYAAKSVRRECALQRLNDVEGGVVYQPRTGARRPDASLRFYTDAMLQGVADTLEPLICSAPQCFDDAFLEFIAPFRRANRSMLRDVPVAVDDDGGDAIALEGDDDDDNDDEKRRDCWLNRDNGLRPKTDEDPFGRGHAWKWRLRRLVTLKDEWDDDIRRLNCECLDASSAWTLAAPFGDMDLRRTYDGRGYALLRNALTPAAVLHLRAMVEIVWRKRYAHLSIGWIMNVHQALPLSNNWLWLLANDARIVGIVAKLLDTDDVVLSGSQLLCRPGGGANQQLPWHQYGRQTCIVVLPLDNFARSFRFVASAHSGPPLKHCRQEPLDGIDRYVRGKPRYLPRMPESAKGASLVPPPNMKRYREWMENEAAKIDDPEKVEAVRKHLEKEEQRLRRLHGPGPLDFNAATAPSSASSSSSPSASSSSANARLYSVDMAALGHESIEAFERAVDIDEPELAAGSALFYHAALPCSLAQNDSGANFEHAIILRYAPQSVRVRSSVYHEHWKTGLMFEKQYYRVHRSTSATEPPSPIVDAEPSEHELVLVGRRFVQL
jgi:hypothetical protein